MSKVNTIKEQCFKESQSWNYERIVKVPTKEVNDKGFYVSKTIKVSLKRDAYDRQSFARVYLFDGIKWNFVYEEPLENCVFKSISYVSKSVTKEDFYSDAERILKVALEIIM